MGPCYLSKYENEHDKKQFEDVETTKIKMIFIGISSAAAGVDKSGDLSPKTNKQRLS